MAPAEPAVRLRHRIRARLARHENLFAFLWYLHLVRNEDPRDQT